MAMEWFRKKVPCGGDIWYRGTMVPRAEEFSYLADQGITVERRKPGANMHWALKLTHADWGAGVMFAPKGQIALPADLVDFDPDLTRRENEDARQGNSRVSFRMSTTNQDLLKDRKSAMRFLRAIMGTDAVAVLDHLATRFWSSGALDHELRHEADLDVRSLFTIHAVCPSDDDSRVTWLHTHGLAEVGSFDFDVIRPAHWLLDIQGDDVLRAIAFAILEGALSIGGRCFAVAGRDSEIAAVDVAAFNLGADPSDAALRDLDCPDHVRLRGVLCDAPRRRFLGRRSKRVKPSSLLSGDLKDGMLVGFSSAASALGAQRARGTYSLLRELVEEFAGQEMPVGVKLGYQVDGGGPDEREHLWFEVHQTLDEQIDATLLNEPIGIERFQVGQRGMHSIDLMSDWIVGTPAGPVTPRSSYALRAYREGQTASEFD